MQGILKLNSSTLREFHILNYIQYDYMNHATKNPKVKVKKIFSNQYIFSFNESIDGELKRVVYRGTFSGKAGKAGANERYLIIRDTYINNIPQVANRRIFVLNSEITFSTTTDKKFVILSSPTYGNIILPTIPPNIVIRGIFIKKVSTNSTNWLSKTRGEKIWKMSLALMIS